MEQSETTLRRGVHILFALGGEESLAEGGLGVVRIAEMVGREKSQVSRTLRTLEDCGVVERHPRTFLYRLSWRFFTLAARAGDHRLLEVAPPLLAKLVSRLGETAHLSVLQGTDVLTVLTHPAPRVIQATGWVGRTIPAYCTSSGRALLMGHSPEQLRERFDGQTFEAMGPNTPRNVDELIARVEEARNLGYAQVADELEPGLVAGAAPIYDFRTRIVAAVNVSAPKYRLAERLDETCREITRTASEISTVLGGRADKAGTAPH